MQWLTNIVSIDSERYNSNELIIYQWRVSVSLTGGARATLSLQCRRDRGEAKRRFKQPCQVSSDKVVCRSESLSKTKVGYCGFCRFSRHRVVD